MQLQFQAIHERENLLQQDDIGILVIDLATRRRVRINGKAEINHDSSIYVHTKQVYFNPKYIQLRKLDTDTKVQLPSIEHTKILTSQQQQWIAHTDTFFIASYHRQGGADASLKRWVSRFCPRVERSLDRVSAIMLEIICSILWEIFLSILK